MTNWDAAAFDAWLTREPYDYPDLDELAGDYYDDPPDDYDDDAGDLADAAELPCGTPYAHDAGECACIGYDDDAPAEPLSIVLDLSRADRAIAELRADIARMDGESLYAGEDAGK